jgi:signal transduction histidine kinase
MGIIADIFGKLSGDQATFTELPWNQGESLYQWIKQRTDEQTGCLREGIGDLPDEPEDKDGVRFAAGAMDGIMSHHSRHQSNPKTINQFVQLIKKVARQKHDKALIDLYHLCVKEDIQSAIDPVIEGLSEAQMEVTPQLTQKMGLLLRRSPHRNPVKLAMAILGGGRDSGFMAEVKTLGLHDEFTLYAAFAIGGMATDPEREWWDLAKKVHGWGRIHLVERLSATQHVGIKEWIFHEGFRNEIMDEYLVIDAASTGGLMERLDQGFVEPKTLQAAADILVGLIQGGPVGDISNYEHGLAAMHAFLRHARQHMDQPLTAVFMATAAIKDYLSALDTEADAQLQSMNEESLQQAEALSQDGRWKQLVKDNIATDSDRLFNQINQMAAMLGMETWKVNVKKLQREPDNTMRWQQAADRVNAARLEVFLKLALSLLPLKKIATGASDELSLGLEYHWHQALNVVLQLLQQHPPKGWPLIKTGLFSPVISNRNLAVEALQTWPAEALNEQVIQLLQQAVKHETHEEIKNHMLELIHG